MYLPLCAHPAVVSGGRSLLSVPLGTGGMLGTWLLTPMADQARDHRRGCCLASKGVHNKRWDQLVRFDARDGKLVDGRIIPRRGRQPTWEGDTRARACVHAQSVQALHGGGLTLLPVDRHEVSWGSAPRLQGPFRGRWSSFGKAPFGGDGHLLARPLSGVGLFYFGDALFGFRPFYFGDFSPDGQML